MVSRPRGGQPHYVTGRDGKPIIGLSRNATDGRFYGTHSKPRRWFGKDYDRALILFREWEARQKGERVTIAEERSPAPAEWREAVEWLCSILPGKHPPMPLPAWLSPIIADLEAGRPPHWSIIVEHLIASDAFWAAVRTAITTDPFLAEQKTGLPLSRLHQYKPLGPSPTLESLGTLYDEKSGVSPLWLKQTRGFWQEFRQSVNVGTIRELTPALITRYRDEIVSAGKSPTYTGHRFGAVKTVLNFARTRGIAPEEIATVLHYCAVLKPPPKKGVNPQPIDRGVFHTLYDAANQKWKAILLCALNFCMHGSEVAALEWADIDLNKRTLVTDRAKTGITRVAVLWKRTAEALKALLEKHPQYVFISREGGPFDPHGFRQAFKRLRKRAGLPADVVFSQLRDGAYSAAVEHAPVVEGEAIPTNAMLLAGHATGMPDHYVKRNPRMVAGACSAIEKAYFG